MIAYAESFPLQSAGTNREQSQPKGRLARLRLVAILSFSLSLGLTHRAEYQEDLGKKQQRRPAKKTRRTLCKKQKGFKLKKDAEDISGHEQDDTFCHVSWRSKFMEYQRGPPYYQELPDLVRRQDILERRYPAAQSQARLLSDTLYQEACDKPQCRSPTLHYSKSSDLTTFQHSKCPFQIHLARSGNGSYAVLHNTDGRSTILIEKVKYNRRAAEDKASSFNPWALIARPPDAASIKRMMPAVRDSNVSWNTQAGRNK